MLTEEGNPISAGASIIRATSNGDADAVRALLAESADVDQRGRGGHTALMVAAIFGHVDIARLLLAAGADVQLQDHLGLTARDWADRRGSWEVAQLLSNASPSEIEPSPKNPPGKPAHLKVATARRRLAAEPKTTSQRDALSGTEDQLRTKTAPERGETEDVTTSQSEPEAVATWSTTGATHSQVEEVAQASTTEPTIAREPDALRFMKFHKQIMAAQERRKAEQARREAEEAPRSSLIKTNTAPHQDAPNLASLSEQGAVATWSSTQATQTETDLPTFPIETNADQQDAPNLASLSEVERSNAEQMRPTALRLARVAATIEHLRLLEESSQRAEGDVSAESDWTAPTRAKLTLDHHDADTTLERRPAGLLIPPVTLEPKTSESFNPLPSKRCPECNTKYENPLLVYCAYDATKLISADDSMFSYPAVKDRSRHKLWALVAMVTVLGASLGYLINNYRSREILSSPPIAAISNAPIATQTEQPETTGTASPLISGELSGMEVDVPEPEYPAQARADGVSGTVAVRVQVNKKGRVVLARSSNGDWRLRAAAVKAAQKATFSPEKLATRGKAISGTITYNFVEQTESPAATGLQVQPQTNSASANGSSPATGTPGANAGGDFPVVGGSLIGTESNLPKPDYPENAKSKGIQGAITVVVRVNRAGKVISWRTLEGDSQLRAAALKAAKRATFSPAKLPGTGEVVGSITYNFKSPVVSGQ